MLSLGLGLALLVALTLIDANIRAQLNRTVPGETPSFFFLDLRHTQAASFADFLDGKAADGKLELVPMMRGRITRVNDVAVAKVKPGDKAAWVLQGDRGITFAASLPSGSTLARGPWWPADYAGKPLVSLEDDIARGLGLKIGDTHRRQRVRPHHHRDGRQHAQGRLAQVRHQFRAGVLAEHLRRRAPTATSPA